MMLRSVRWAALFVLLIPLALLFGQGTYYNSIDTTSSSFVSSLHALINSHTRITYDQFDETNVANFASRDTTGGQRAVTCVYSGYIYVYTAPFTYAVFSREHTWCQSWMPSVAASGFTSRPEYSDQHHLFPVHQNNANGVRSNHPLGKVVSVSNQFMEGKLGTDSAGHTVYEPRASHKGDAARALLYMALCYNGSGGYDWTFDHLNTSILPGLSEATQSPDLLIQWSKADPPDAWEQARNEYVYSIQGNRNPFIDHPSWVDLIDFNTLTLEGSTLSTEPTNFPTAFSASSTSSGSVQLSWTDAASGVQAPSGYLLLANTTNSFSTPSDGVAYTDDANLGDGSATVNIAHPSAQSYTFTGLTPSTTYYFKLYSYNGSGTYRNYKTDGSVPSASSNAGSGTSASGSIYVVVVGDGSATLSSVATTTFLCEYTVGGSLVRTIALPTSASGLNGILTNAGSSTTEGSLSRSYNGQYLLLAGYNAPVGTVAVAGTASSTYARVVALVDALGNIDTSTKLGDAFSAGNIRGVTSSDGSTVWMSGSTGGVRSAAFGASTSTVVSTSVTNTRTPQVFNGQLFVSSASGTFQGISSVGSGTPTSSGQTTTLLPGFPTASGPSPMGFSMNSAGTGLYVADDRAIASGGGVQKWEMNSGVWALSYTLSTNLSVGARGLAVDWSGTNPIIYITDASASGNKLWSVTDAGSTSGFFLVATAATNTAFRGVALAPYASCDFENGTAYAPPTPVPGNANNPVGRFKLSANVSGGSLTTVTVNTTGTRSGVNALKLYYSTQSSFSVGTSIFLASASDESTAAFTFSGQAIPTSGGYFFLVADLAAGSSGTIAATLASESSLGFTNALVPTPFANAGLSSASSFLPVELTAFTATANRLNATLSWTTATEVENAGWEIERRTSSNVQSGNGQWSKVGFVAGAGSSNVPRTYYYADAELPAGRYAYRLKQIDHSGAATYSFAAEVEVGTAPMTFALNEAYPNPFNPSTKIGFTIQATGFTTLRVFNLLGQIVATLYSGIAEAGVQYERTFEAGHLPTGLYLMRLESNGQSSVKRLMLLK